MAWFWRHLIVTMATLLVARPQRITQETCDRRQRFATVRPDADVMIAGVFPVRAKGQSSYGCGDIGAENYRIMTYEAARFAVERINAVNFIPGMTLGLKAYDSCSTPSVAVAGLDDFFQTSNGWQCQLNRSQIALGAIGGYDSDVTADMAEFLSFSGIPTVAFGSTRESTAENIRHSTLLQTSASMAEIVRAITATLNALEWTRIGVVYTEDEFGKTLYTSLKRDSGLAGVCVAEGVGVATSNTNQRRVNSGLRRLVSSNIQVIVLAVDQPEAAAVLQNLDRLMPRNVNIQIISPHRIIDSSGILPGTMAVIRQESEVPGFVDSLARVNPRFPPNSNPWFSDWYMRKFRCRLLGNVAEAFRALPLCRQLTETQRRGAYSGELDHSLYREAIKAVYAFAAAIRRARQSRCGGRAAGSCPSLVMMSHEDFNRNYLSNVDYTMRAGDGIPSMSNSRIAFDRNGYSRNGHNFAIYNYNRRQGQLTYKRIGNYSSGRLDLDRAAITLYDRGGFRTLPAIPRVGCTGEECAQCLSSGELQYWYNPGDVIIVGLTSVHQAGTEAAACGRLDVTNSFRALSFQQSVQDQNDPNSPLKIGSLLVDMCQSEARLTDFLDRFYSGSLQLRDDSGNPILANNVIGTVDMLDGDMAQIVAQYARELKSPVVGTVATDIDLGNREAYPYYSQRVLADNKEADAVSYFLQEMGWTYIQTVNSADVYGRSGTAAFRKAAAAASICIAQSLEVGTDGNSGEIIRKIRTMPQAGVIVVFGSGTMTSYLMRALRISAVSQNFVIISTEWPDDSESAAARRSFTVRLTGNSDTRYKTFLRQLNPRQTETKYVTELYQSVFNCQIVSSNEACNDSAKLVDSPLFDGRTQAAAQFVARAVTLMGTNLQAAYQETCGRCGSSFDKTRLQQSLQTKLTDESSAINGTFEVLGYRLRQGKELTKVAEYSPDRFTMSISTGDLLTLMGVGNNAAQCEGFCGQCSYLVNHHPYIYQPGDVMFGSLLGIMGWNENPFRCDSSSLGSGYQHAAAILFAVDQLNAGDAPVALNNVSLGTIVLDDCNSDHRAVGVVNELYTGVTSSLGNMDLNQISLNGWLSHSQSNVFNVAANLFSFQTPLLVSEASSLGEKEISASPMLFSTAPILNQKAVTVVRMLLSLGYEYFQTIYSPDAAGRKGVDILKKVAIEEGLCLVNAVELSGDINAHLEEVASDHAKAVVVIADSLQYADKLQTAAAEVRQTDGLLFFTLEPLRFNNKPIAKNVISIKVEPVEIPGYQSYLREKTLDSDQFYRFYYQSAYKCDLPGSSKYNKSCALEAERNFQVDEKIYNTVNAVYALASAIHKTLQEKCSLTYNGVCSEFRTARDTNTRISENLAQVSFATSDGESFGFSGRRVNQNFDVVIEEQSGSQQIGIFNAGRLLVTRSDLLQRFSSIKSTCRQPCLKCSPQSFFDYVQGDIYLAGIFNIHYKSVEPFACGKIKTIFGYQSLEAFKYAIEKVNRKVGTFSGILNGVKLGGLGLDACDSAVRTAYLAANIHNGETVLSKNGSDISPEDIIGYVAARESDQSRHLARVLNILDIPQISYGSTSIELGNWDRYPRFARTVPIDDRQSDAILAFLDKYDLRYVQVLRSPTSYGELGSKVFLDKALSRRICVAQTVTFRDERGATKEIAAEAVDGLLENPTANVVVVFADIGYINEFLKAVKRTPAARGKFLFVGTVAWNRNEVLLEGVEEVAHGSVIVNVEKVDIAQFDQYLEKKSLASERDNNWFQEYYETIHDCRVTLSVENRVNGESQCDRRHQNIVTSGNYLQDPDVLHVTNAVYAAAYGLDYALKALCGQNYTGVCREFKERESRRQLMFEGALKARFQDEAFTPFRFREDRSGNKGYTLYSIEPTTASGTYNYVDIGKYSESGVLELRGFKTSWNGSCNRQDTCNECPGVRDQTTRVHRINGIGGSRGKTKGVVPKIVSVFDLHYAQDADEFRCGTMKHASVFDNVLAFMYTLDFFGKQGLDIGGLVLDTCSRSVRLYPELLKLLKGSGYCSSQHVAPGITEDLSNIIGVVSYGEENALVANRILTPMSVTSVSPNSVSPTLSDVEKFPFFLRTKTPYDVQGQAILDLLRALGWTYVSVVYTGDDQGSTVNNYLLRNSLGDGSEAQAICIGASLLLANGDGQSIANDHVRTLDQQGIRGSRVAILLTSPEHSELMLQAIREVQPDTRLVLVGFDDWGLSPETFASLGDYLVNSVSLRTFSPQVPSFLEYKSKFGYQDSQRHGLPSDWFEEYYQHTHRCFLSNSTVSQSNLYQRPCQMTERLDVSTTRHDPDVFHTIISTYTLATALRNVSRNCGDGSVTDCFTDNTFREAIFQSSWDTTWSDIIEDLDLSQSELEQYMFRYTSGRYGNTGYLIYSVGALPTTGEPFYGQIGRWNGAVTMDNEGNYTGVDGFVVESSCYGRLSCSCQFVGGEEAAQTGVGRWGEEVLRPRNYYVLHRTAKGGKVSYTRVIEWPIWAVVIAILTVIMILVTLVVFAVLLFLYPVKSGTTVLGFMLLIGILGIFLINFAFFVHAGAASCGARRFVMGVVYAICFAALLVKAIDNWRYNQDDYYMGKRKYKGVTSACCLLLIALTIVGIQVLIGILWLVITAPGATLVSIAPPPHDFWWCNPPLLYDVGLVLSFLFVILLIIATIVFATVSFLKDINHFESRWLLASCLCTGAIFVAWMIISTMASAPYRDPTVAIANLLNGTILLFFFPIRKIWLMYQRNKFGDNMYETRSRASDCNMSATEHMELSEKRRAMEEKGMADYRAMMANRSMDQSFIQSSAQQSAIYSHPRNAYAASTLNRSGIATVDRSDAWRRSDDETLEKTALSGGAVAGNLRHTAPNDTAAMDLRKERKTTSVVKQTTTERTDQSGAASTLVGKRDEGPIPVIVAELLEKREDRRPHDGFVMIPPKPYIQESHVTTRKTYIHDFPDDSIPSNLSASYEVDELSFDPNVQSQRTEWHRHETRAREPLAIPLHVRRADGPPSKSRSSSSASSFTSSRLDRPLVRQRESELALDPPLMEMDRDVALIPEFGDDPQDGHVDRQRKKTTVVETDDFGTTKKTTTVEETSYIEY